MRMILRRLRLSSLAALLLVAAGCFPEPDPPPVSNSEPPTEIRPLADKIDNSRQSDDDGVQPVEADTNVPALPPELRDQLKAFEQTVVFQRPQASRGDWDPEWLEFENVNFRSADGTKLHGWYVEHAEPKVHVLFCHGNAEHVADLGQMLDAFRTDFRASVFAFDYRGYGRSEGKPDEPGVLADGHAAQLWLADKAGIPPDRVVLIGRSLGGAIAVDLAVKNGARGLVLQRTFTSIPDVAVNSLFAPLRPYMTIQFDSANKIESYSKPLLQSHGTADRVIPFQLGRKLYSLASGEKKMFFTEEGSGHSDAYSAEYWQTLQEFLNELP